MLFIALRNIIEVQFIIMIASYKMSGIAAIYVFLLVFSIQTPTGD